MTYMPELRRGLVEAARRESEGVATTLDEGPKSATLWRALKQWTVLEAWRSRRWMRVALNLGLSAAGVLVGLTASGAFQRGTAIHVGLPISASSGEGSAVRGSVKLLPIRTADPAGGLPWGLRMLRTTRGLTCVEVGRVDFGTIGILGVDGAAGNDRRFHPLSPDVIDPMGCAKTDAHGHGYLNVAIEDVPASGLSMGNVSGGSGCRPTEEAAGEGPRPLPHGLPKAVARRMRELEARERERPACRFGDLREIYYGLLGPDAVSITHRSPSGTLETTPTVGSDGAYLLVIAQPRDGCLDRRFGFARMCRYAETGERGGPKVQPGLITAVTYRDGHTCHVVARSSTFSTGSCPPAGYVAPPHRRIIAATVASPIHVERLPGTSFCAKRGPIPVQDRESTKPCGSNVPAGYERIAKPSVMLRVSFISRIAIASASGEYEIDYYFPRTPTQRRGCNGGGGMATAMDFNIKRGQRLSETRTFPIDCPGLIRGKVKYVSTPGPGGPSPEMTGQRSLLVGRFSFRVR